MSTATPPPLPNGTADAGAAHRVSAAAVATMNVSLGVVLGLLALLAVGSFGALAVHVGVPAQHVDNVLGVGVLGYVGLVIARAAEAWGSTGRA